MVGGGLLVFGFRANGESNSLLIISGVWHLQYSKNDYYFGYGHSPLVLWFIVIEAYCWLAL